MKTDFVLYCLLGLTMLILTVFGGYISSGNKMHQKIFLFFGLIGFILIIATGWRNYQAQIKTQETSNQLNDALNNLKKASDENNNLITGGDSFGYLFISYEIRDQEKINPLIAFRQEGKYPLYDVSIKIIEKNKSNIVKDYIHDFFSADINIDIGTVPVGKAIFLRELQKMLTRSHAYQIHIEAKNGTWEEQFRIIVNSNGAYLQAIRVYKSPNFEKSIFERVDDNFPRNKEGKINWKG